MEIKMCEGPECGRPGTRRNLCNTHYHQKYAMGQELQPIRPTYRTKPDEWYVEQEMNRLIAKQANKGIKCTGPECDREATNWTPQPLCRGHYMQHWTNRPLTPLRKVAERQDPNAETRICNCCHRIKSKSEFYIRNNGKIKSECKYCEGKRARINALKREGRNDEAKALQAVWEAHKRPAELNEGKDPNEFI